MVQDLRQPIIALKLTVEGVKHTLIQYLADYEQKIQEQVRLQVKEYMDKVDVRELFENEIKDQVRRQLEWTVRREAVEIAKKVVDEAVSSVVDKLKNSDE